MASYSTRLEMERFSGTIFELWKFKMEDMLVDRDMWKLVSGVKFETCRFHISYTV